MWSRVFIVLISFVFASNAEAQYLDTISVMHYNILNYRNHFNECSDTTNNVQHKESELAKIIAYMDPDIISFNEIQASQGSIDSLVQNALNGGTLPQYSAAGFSGSGFLANALAYKNESFVYHSHDSISKDLSGNDLVRQIDVHILYHRNTQALSNGDTTFLAVYVVHFKAGSTISDLDEREAMAKALMAYHESNYKSYNYLLCGDFNVRSSSELSFQELVNFSNSSVRFYDPINQLGAWNSNSNFASTHTQSTRAAETNNGCFSAGGLDDRFDFILVGNEILAEGRKVRYLNGSYKAIGNDGGHFNKDIKSPANNSVPLNILNALYDISDHLPVYMELIISSNFSVIHDQEEIKFKLNNPADAELKIWANGLEIDQIRIYNSFGMLVYGIDSGFFNTNPITIGTSSFEDGTYIVELITANGIYRQKIIILQG